MVRSGSLRQRLLAHRQAFHQLVQKRLPLVERLHLDALVAAVESDVVAIVEDALHAVRRNAGRAQIQCRRLRPSPSSGRSARRATATVVTALTALQQVVAHRRRRARAWRAVDRERHRGVGDDALQRRRHVLDRSSGSTRQLTFAAASCGSAFFACPPSSCVATHVVRSVAFQGVDAFATRAIAAVSPSRDLRRDRRSTGPFSIFDIALEVRARHVVGLEREAELRQSIERAGEVVDRVVRDRQRAVAALVAHLEPIVDDVLLAHLDVVREPRAA